MNGLKMKSSLHLWLMAMLSVSVMACEGLEVGDSDAGPMGGEGGEGGMGGEGGEGGEGGGGGAIPEDTELSWVVIFDDSEGDSGSGTAGADICGVSAQCDGMRLTGVETLYEAGEGEICTAEGPGCSADRGDPEAAMDDGETCVADSSPSDYISLGLSGVLSVDMGRDLRGCAVTVREFEGADPERAEVYVCDSATINDETICANSSLPFGGGAGEISFTVPAE